MIITKLFYKSKRTVEEIIVDKNGGFDRYGKTDDYVSVFSYDSYDLVWK